MLHLRGAREAAALREVVQHGGEGQEAGALVLGGACALGGGLGGGDGAHITSKERKKERASKLGVAK